MIVIAVVSAYGNSLHAAFVFDDRITILNYGLIRGIFPLTRFLETSRPVADFSFALNYALGELDPRGYHAVNLAIHLAAGLTLFGVVRRTLLSPRLGERFKASAASLALATTLLWVVHPLQTQSVTYITQRCESLMGLCYLLVLYAAIRAGESRRPLVWYAIATATCAAGMGAKAVMVTAPVVVFVYDWLFAPPASLRPLLRRRWPLYLGLAAGWSVLWGLGILSGVRDTPQKEIVTVGFGYNGVSPGEYAATQPGVIVHYLRLCIWPTGQCLDYGWRVARNAGAIAGPAIIIAGLLGATLWLALRRQPAAFLGVWFFFILAPTSSFIPIKDLAFEHRMYLPLAAVIVTVVLAGYAILRRLSPRDLPAGNPGFVATTSVGLAVMILLLATIRRNAFYSDPVALWRDNAAKTPWNPRAVNTLGSSLSDRGDIPAAINAFQEALRIDPTFAAAHANLGSVLWRQGRPAEAVDHYRRALALDPNQFGGELWLYLGGSLLQANRTSEAIIELQRAVQRMPKSALARAVLGDALRMAGRKDEAAATYRYALRLQPDLESARQGLAAVEKSHAAPTAK